jgi:PhnB protein
MTDERKPNYGTVVPYVFYEDAVAMLDWFARVFGWVEIGRWADASGRIHNAEMLAGTSEIWIDGGGPAAHLTSEDPRLGRWIGVWVDDPDLLYRRVRDAGVEVDPPVDRPFGVRMCTVTDPGGYHWCFMKRI